MQFQYENRVPGQITANHNYGRRLSDGAHLHNHIELVYMIEGKALAFAENQEYLLQSGEIFIAFPNQIHKYVHTQNDEFILLIFPPELCPEFQELFTRSVPTSPICHGVQEHSRLAQLLRELPRINDPELPFYSTEIKGCFLAMLSELFRRMSFEAVSTPDNDTVRDVLNYCAQNYAGNLQLDAVSQALHINKYYISHLFTQKLHVRFNEYVGMLRISAAQQLLDAGNDSITDIAYSVGFNSTRSFNRLFLKYMNTTPREYRAHRYGNVEEE